MNSIKAENPNNFSPMGEPEHAFLSPCTRCNKDTNLAELRMLPESERAYRLLALEKISLEELNAMKLDTKTLLCPECMEMLLLKNKVHKD